MDDRLSKTYQPTKSARALVIAFVLPGTLLIGWVGSVLLHQTVVWGIVTILIAVLLCVWTIFITTSHVNLTKEQLTRTWQWGSCAIPMEEITKLEWSSGRGQLHLVVRAGKTWVGLSSLSFRDQELREMASVIVAARGLEGQPRWPPEPAPFDWTVFPRR
jgi:hypothetical protein